MDAREKLSVTLSIVLFLFLNQRQDIPTRASLPWKGFVFKNPGPENQEEAKAAGIRLSCN
jgi:hypothetical protein